MGRGIEGIQGGRILKGKKKEFIQNANMSLTVPIETYPINLGGKIKLCHQL